MTEPLPPARPEAPDQAAIDAALDAEEAASAAVAAAAMAEERGRAETLRSAAAGTELDDSTAADVLLRAHHVTKRFGGLVAVREADLEIPRGAIVSIIGPNGAGKTTFFNVLAGIIDPTAGYIDFAGQRMIARPVRAWLEPVIWVLPPILVLLVTLGLRSVTNAEAVFDIGVLASVGTLIASLLLAIVRPAWYTRLLARVGVFKSARPNDMVAAGVGRTFQNIRLFQNMSAAENVLVGMHHRLHSNLIDAILSTPRRRREEIAARQRAEELLALVGLKGRGDVVARSLPYGDQRRLEVARALASDPQLLLLDEPTAGMNPNETAELTVLIGKLRADLGLTILLIEHDMRVVMGISDRITVLDHGERIAEGTPEQVRANPKVIEAYLGAPAS